MTERDWGQYCKDDGFDWSSFNGNVFQTGADFLGRFNEIVRMRKEVLMASKDSVFVYPISEDRINILSKDQLLQYTKSEIVFSLFVLRTLGFSDMVTNLLEVYRSSETNGGVG